MFYAAIILIYTTDFISDRQLNNSPARSCWLKFLASKCAVIGAYPKTQCPKIGAGPNQDCCLFRIRLNVSGVIPSKEAINCRGTWLNNSLFCS